MPRKHWSAETKLEIVRAVLGREESVGAVCRRYGCSLRQAQRWLREAEAGMRAALRDKRFKSHRDPEQQHIAELERALGRKEMQIVGLKKTLGLD